MMQADISYSSTTAPVPSSFALTLSDLNAALDDEPRVQDLRLAQSLGFDRPRNIRLLIERNRAELERYGVICFTAKQNTGRGRPATVYWLTEGQALCLAALSNAPRAPEARYALITVFMAYRRDQAAPALPAPAMSPSCKGCAFGEFHEILRSETVPAKALLKGLSPEALAEVMTPPNQDEMALITDRRKERRELIEQVRREIASRLFGSGGRE